MNLKSRIMKWFSHCDMKKKLLILKDIRFIFIFFCCVKVVLVPHFLESWIYSVCLNIVRECEEFVAVSKLPETTLTLYEGAKGEILQYARMQVSLIVLFTVPYPYLTIPFYKKFFPQTFFIHFVPLFNKFFQKFSWIL